jgi:hypothetical protein
MEKSELRVGMEVMFGRPGDRAEKTRGKIVKLNPKRAKIQSLENRGKHGQSATWVVPYALIYPVGGECPKPKPDISVEPIKASVFQDKVDAQILQAIYQCYMELSPENLTGDGELPGDRVVARRKILMYQLHHLQLAFGRPVSEMVAINWQSEYSKLWKSS